MPPLQIGLSHMMGVQAPPTPAPFPVTSQPFVGNVCLDDPWNDPQHSPTLQDVGRLGGGGQSAEVLAGGYCQRAQGRDGPYAPCFHGNIGGVMTASTATPSARDLVNDEKNRNRKAPRSQARTTLRYQWRGRGLKTLEFPGASKPKLSWGSTY